MKVQDLMTKTVESCFADTTLAEAAAIMKDRDCGVLPIVSGDRFVTGILTDRDICMTVAEKNRRPEDLRADDIHNPHLYTCAPEDNIQHALKIMRTHRIRRLPVVRGGHLVGIISLNDIVLAARETAAKGKETASYEQIVNTMKAICGHHPQAVAA